MDYFKDVLVMLSDSPYPVLQDLCTASWPLFTMRIWVWGGAPNPKVPRSSLGMGPAQTDLCFFFEKMPKGCEMVMCFFKQPKDLGSKLSKFWGNGEKNEE